MQQVLLRARSVPRLLAAAHRLDLAGLGTGVAASVLLLHSVLRCANSWASEPVQVVVSTQARDQLKGSFYKGNATVPWTGDVRLVYDE